MSYFWDYLFNNQSANLENWQLGKAMNYAKDKIASVINVRSHAWCYSWYSAHLFGDPAQTLRLNVTNNPVTISNENPTNGAADMPLSLDILNVTIYDSDGQGISWTIETTPNIGSNSGINETNGIKACNISDLNYGTTYYWYVSATDGQIWTNKTYNFTTQSQYILNPPNNFTANPNSRFQIDLTWNKSDHTDYTYIEWNTFSSPWNQGEGNFIYNGSDSSTLHDGLGPNTTRYYQAWSWNSTDNIWSSSYSTCNASTFENNPPEIFDPNPINGSSDQNRSFLWTIQIQDDDGDSLGWSIECSNDQSNSSNGDQGGTKTLLLSSLDYDTTYIVWVNVTDGFDSDNKWYDFSTILAPDINNNPLLTEESPPNDSTGVQVSFSSLTIKIEDPDGDNFDWTIETSPNIGNNSGLNDTNGSKTCSISGLSYSTTYYWIVNAFDGTDWTNETYNFKTSSPPGSSSASSSGGGYIPPVNDNPIADAGGPYSGTVNESIQFDGSESSDNDGNIVSYQWNFGDGQAGSGEKTTHKYSKQGNYTVTLEVTDDDSGTDSDASYALIIQLAQNETDNSSDDVVVGDSVNDNELGGLQAFIEENLDSSVDEAPNVINFIIEGVTHKLIDIDNNGKYDYFYNTLIQSGTQLGFDKDQYYLIDIDDDGSWDYKYDFTQSSFALFTTIPEKETLNTFTLKPFNILIIAIVILSCILLLFILRKTSHETQPDSLDLNAEKLLAKQEHIHYFADSKDNPSDIDLTQFNQMQETLEEVQTNYDQPSKSQEDIVDDLILQHELLKQETLYENEQPVEDEDIYSEMHDRIDRLLIDRLLEENESKEETFDIDDLVDEILYSRNKNKPDN
jgi:hypothetical protein